MASTTLFSTYGSSALKVRRLPAFVVLEGGLSKQAFPHNYTDAVYAKHQEDCAQVGVKQTCARLSTVFLALSLTVLIAISLSSYIIDQTRLAATNQALQALETQDITVHTGDSLWDLAERYDVADVATADVVQWIKSKNSLETSEIKAGQTLVVPLVR